MELGSSKEWSAFIINLISKSERASSVHGKMLQEILILLKKLSKQKLFPLATKKTEVACLFSTHKWN